MHTFYQGNSPTWKLLPLFCLFGLNSALAQQGKSGAGTITTANTVVNEYTALTANVAAGSTSIAVANNTLNLNGRFGANLAPGDLVMLVQMQGASITSTATDNTYGAVTNYNSAGKNELLEVRSVSGTNTITFYCGTSNAYTTSGHAQVIRIPRYTALTLNTGASITASPWNGTIGGVVAIESQGNVTFNSNAAIDVSGQGFRGGALHNVSSNPSAGANYVSNLNNYGGEKGESIAGYQTEYDALGGRYGRGAAANGGGGGNTHNAGGGGGANVGTGTWTGTGNPNRGLLNLNDNAWNQESANFATSSSPGGGRGGYTYSSNDQNAGTTAPGNATWGGDNRKNLGGQGGRPLATTGGLLFLGGGGGAGDENDGVGTAGASGGGLVYLLVGGNVVNATNATNTAIRANGAGAAASGIAGTSADAPGGGGGGGTVVLNVAGTIGAVAVSATGGAGGNQTVPNNSNEAEGPGGGGGGGYIVYTTVPTTTPSATGGANGTTNSQALNEFTPNGATAGGAGLTATISYAAQCAIIADVSAAFTSPTGATTATAGASQSYTVQFANTGPDAASGVTRTVNIPANAASSVTAPGGTVTGSQAAGWTITYPGGTVPASATPTSYTFSLIPASTGGTFTLTAASATSTNQGGNATANDSDTRTLTVNAVTVAGTIFEDVNYGGGAGRPASASGTVGRSGATVEFYDNAGNYVGSTTTGTNGAYSYNLPAAGTYTVRVVNSTVSSSRTGYTTGLLPVQTYNGTTTAVGGLNPAFTDAAANTGNQTLTALRSGTTTTQSIASITAGSGSTTGIDFGYNFDTVVNTNDSGQGSLRQFITNANALGGEATLAQAGSYTNPENLLAGSTAAGRAGVTLPAGVESSIFMIPAGQLTSGVAVITPASVLPQITGANTAINGATQTFNIGNTNDVLLGSGGTVGTQATALSQLNGPEVQLTGSTAVAFGLDVAASATNSRIRGLAIYGFGNNPDNNAAANIRSAASTITITQNVLGTTATSFATPPTATNADNVRLTGGTSGVVVSSNLIGFGNSKGISINPGVTNVQVTGNEVRGNGLSGANFDGVDIQGSSATISNNLFTGTSGQGVDSYRSAGSNTITGNTITDNGRGTTTIAPNETPGIRIYGAGNRLSQNVIANNYGAGIMLSGTNATATNTVISQNSIYGNGTVVSRNNTAATGEVGIDLQANGDNEAAGNSPYVTLNSATTTGANGLVNYPIITSAYVSGSSLVVNGYAKSGATIELFTAQPNPTSTNSSTTVLASNFGQGRTYLTTVTEGSTTGVTDADTRTGLSYSGAINGFNQGSDTNANGFSFVIPISSLPGGALAAGTVLTSTATLNGATSEYSGNATLASLSGYVFEDVNYGGGAGRPRSTSGTVGRAGATVELYNGSTFIGSTTTDSNGQYTFGVTAGTYTVRVVNSTVSSSRTGYTTGLLPVQTYNGTTTAVGGANPLFTDAAANTGSQTLTALNSGTTTAQSVAAVTTTGATATGPDFGYNFDTVVNTNDSGQGSLRQFITNANALGGEATLAQAGSNTAGTLPAGRETSIFMIPTGQLTGGVAAITPASALPAITGDNTAIDGTTQTFNVGNTNNVALGNGGTVGTSATALAQLNGPEVQLKGSNSFNGLSLTANNTTVRGLSLYGFNDNIFGGADKTGTLIEQNVIGASATSFTDPGAGNRTLNEGIDLNGSDNGTVRNNLIGFNGGMGVWVANDINNSNNGANNNTISGNEIRGNGITTIAGNGERLVYDGIEILDVSTNNTISGNLITANYGHGIDTNGNTIGGNTISGNTISSNGVGVVTDTGEEGSGIRMFGATNPSRISGNVLSSNNGSGVLVIGSANQVTISQNSTFGNTRLGIDLISETGPTVFFNGNTGTTSNVTRNDNGDADTGGNGLLNFPVITSATVQGGNLIVRGFARPGSAIELFTPSSTPNGVASNVGFGQGQTYLGTFTEGSGADTDNGTGTYSGLINGLNQGTDNTNRFSFTIPLTGNFASYAVGSQLTSTATLNNSTSEFSGNVRVNLPPTANNVTNVAVLTSSPAAVLNPNLSATPNSAGVTIASYTVTDLSNINGTLTYNGTVLTSANIASTLITDLSKLTYKPTLGYTGNATFTYLATDSNGIPSNTATYTIPVSPVADMVAAFPNGTPTTVTANGPLSLTVNFTDNGPNDAANVTRSVQLPAGLGTVSVSNGGTYNNATGLVTFSPTPATTLAANSTLSSTITIATVPVGMSSITAVATTATTTSEGGATANNTAATTVAVIPSFDLATTVSGPATFVAGTLATYTVTTSNNGPSAIGTPGEAANGTTAAIPATGAVQTVQLPANLSGVFATNGGTYNASTGVVTFPDVALASGQLVTNTISFSVPAATSSFSVAATVAKTSTLAGTDTQSANNTASTTTSVTAPSATTTNLYVTASGPAQVAGGSTASYTITQGNYGPVAASNVQTQVSLPTGLTGTTLTLTNNGTAATVSSTTGGVISFSDGSKYTQATGVLVLPALTTQNSAATPQTYVVGVTAPSTTTNPAMNITASVGAATSDNMPANNVSTVETEVQPLTDVSIVLTNLSTTSSGAALGGSNLLAGQTASYEIQATNTSTNPARNVQQSVALPSSIDPSTLLLNGATGNLSNGVVTFANGATYTVSTGTLTLPTIADLMGGAVQTTLLSFTVPAPNSSSIFKMPVAATISTSTPESGSANNATALTTNVASAQDVAVSLSGPTQSVVGNPVLYTVSTTNNGPSANGTQTTTVTLPSALDPTTLLINNAASTSVASGVYNFAGGITYTASTGVVMYPAASLSLPKTGQSAVSTIQFVAPNVTLLNAVANVSGVSNDLNSTNNSATVITPLSTSDLASLDLSTTVAASATSGTVGSSDTFTVTTTNGSTTTAASGLTQTLVLPAGLTSNGGTVTTTNGGVYNNQTGVVTFPIGYLAAGASVASSATISLPASPVGSANATYTLTATGSSFTTNPETNVANNTATTNVSVGSKYDLTAAISGPAAAPAGSTVSYTVGLTNAGPSSATGVTGTFTLPAGVTSYTVTGPTGTPTTVSGSGTVTFRSAANLLTGQSEQWQISFTAPNSTFTATANIAATGPVAESDVLPNAASTTTIVNQGPVAYDVVNKAELPVGNTANAMPLTALNGADTDGGSIAKYTIASLPSSNAGTLYYNGAAASVGTVVTDPTALTFKPLSTFVGNAFFTYTATDNGNGTPAAALTSALARYTIPVGQDNSSVATASTQTKGGATPYISGDVLAYIVDANGAQYTANSGATPGIVYNAATGVLQSGAANGLTSASLVAGAGPAGNTANTLPAGVSLNPTTGQVFVSDASQLVNNPTARTYSVNVTTVDVNGGITTTPVTFTIGANPLPVSLVAFTTQAVQNRDALLKWTTASELSNDHFEVERSLDGTTFVQVGQRKGQGTKATATDYTFTDAGIGARATSGQLVYYRLKQVDQNGTSTYSPVRSVSFSSAAAALVALYPNPAAAATSLDLSALPAGNTYQVLLLDATGRQVRQATALGGQVQPLDLHDLATGTYHVLVSGQQGSAGFRQVLRLTKE